jgi:hypothetical protein
MSWVAKFLGFVLVVSVMLGCGGHTTDSDPNVPSLYAGSWTGTTVSSETGGVGTITLAIDGSGNTTATLVGTDGLEGNFQCVLTGDGHFSSNTIAGTDPTFTAIVGALTVQNAGQTDTAMTGTFSFTYLNKSYLGTLTATVTTTTPAARAAATTHI